MEEAPAAAELFQTTKAGNVQYTSSSVLVCSQHAFELAY
jgi:hypothetical protein